MVPVGFLRGSDETRCNKLERRDCGPGFPTTTADPGPSPHGTHHGKTLPHNKRECAGGRTRFNGFKPTTCGGVCHGLLTGRPASVCIFHCELGGDVTSGRVKHNTCEVLCCPRMAPRSQKRTGGTSLTELEATLPLNYHRAVLVPNNSTLSVQERYPGEELQFYHTQILPEFHRRASIRLWLYSLMYVFDKKYSSTTVGIIIIVQKKYLF
mmetsp:Transcript_38433/g.38786  ORF Transcript_38433/g.38786 Transcript_38433/m.38786 type:complete len:210 (-) Transcript_38433:357-986(-)